MSKYAEINYPNDENNQYPLKLITYIYNRFMKPSGTNHSSRKILDIGCSSGEALKLFSRCEDFELYGVDLRDENVKGINFQECNLENEKLPFPDNYFDFIYNKSVIEHINNTDNFVSESLRVLKPGGLFVCLTPDWKSQYKSFWNDYTHVKPFTRKGLRNVLRIYNFENVDCEIFYQLPFLWKYPKLVFIAKLIALLPDSWRWKDDEQVNTKDRKLIRFSKEKMLLSYGAKK